MKEKTINLWGAIWRSCIIACILLFASNVVDVVDVKSLPVPNSATNLTPFLKSAVILLFLCVVLAWLIISDRKKDFKRLKILFINQQNQLKIQQSSNKQLTEKLQKLIGVQQELKKITNERNVLFKSCESLNTERSVLNRKIEAANKKINMLESNQHNLKSVEQKLKDVEFNNTQLSNEYESVLSENEKLKQTIISIKKSIAGKISSYKRKLEEGQSEVFDSIFKEKV